MNYEQILDELRGLAERNSNCTKAQVGARIVSPRRLSKIAEGFNITLPENCKVEGCHRMKVYGEYSYLHRLPSDCFALHAEINAIATAACRSNKSTIGKTMIVTRYPCEACARAIVAAGITKVIYGGVEEISSQTKEIFERNEVEVKFILDKREW